MTVAEDRILWNRRPVDVGACLVSYKAALDGVVLAGVLPDDSPVFVRSVKFTAPVYAGRDALIITLEGPAA